MFIKRQQQRTVCFLRLLAVSNAEYFRKEYISADGSKKVDRNGDEWIQCDICIAWFHIDCTEIEEFQSLLLDKYHCQKCAITVESPLPKQPHERNIVVTPLTPSVEYSLPTQTPMKRRYPYRRNPFEANLLDSLQSSAFSPSVFKTPDTSRVCIFFLFFTCIDKRFSENQ